MLTGQMILVYTIWLAWDSDSLKLIRRIRDEVHRFGVNFHRNQRSRGTFVNVLEQIKGIGKSTADLLLKQFKSVKKIRELSLRELSQLTGLSKAKIIQSYFQQKSLPILDEKVINTPESVYYPLQNNDRYPTIP